jgi:hypothetical protein
VMHVPVRAESGTRNETGTGTKPKLELRLEPKLKPELEPELRLEPKLEPKPELKGGCPREEFFPGTAPSAIAGLPTEWENSQASVGHGPHPEMVVLLQIGL